MRMTVAALTAILLIPATAAVANPCGFVERARLVVPGYEARQTAIPEGADDALTAFARSALASTSVCILAVVEATGQSEIDRNLAESRGRAIKTFLTRKGVPEAAISIAAQKSPFIVFGLTTEPGERGREVIITRD